MGSRATEQAAARRALALELEATAAAGRTAAITPARRQVGQTPALGAAQQLVARQAQVAALVVAEQPVVPAEARALRAAGLLAEARALQAAEQLAEARAPRAAELLAEARAPRAAELLAEARALELLAEARALELLEALEALVAARCAARIRTRPDRLVLPCATAAALGVYV